MDVEESEQGVNPLCDWVAEPPAREQEKEQAEGAEEIGPEELDECHGGNIDGTVEEVVPEKESVGPGKHESSYIEEQPSHGAAEHHEAAEHRVTAAACEDEGMPSLAVPEPPKTPTMTTSARNRRSRTNVGMPPIAAAKPRAQEGKNDGGKADKCSGGRSARGRLIPKQPARNTSARQGKPPLLSPRWVKERETQYRIVYGKPQHRYRVKRNVCQHHPAACGGTQSGLAEDDAALSFSGHIHNVEKQLHKYLCSFNTQCEECTEAGPLSSYKTVYGTKKASTLKAKCGESQPPFILGDSPRVSNDPLWSVNRQLSEYTSRQRLSDRGNPMANTEHDRSSSRGVPSDGGCTWRTKSPSTMSQPQQLEYETRDELQHCARLFLDRFGGSSERRDLGYSYRCILLGKQKQQWLSGSTKGLPGVRWATKKDSSPPRPPFRHRAHDRRVFQNDKVRTNASTSARSKGGRTGETSAQKQATSPHHPAADTTTYVREDWVAERGAAITLEASKSDVEILRGGPEVREAGTELFPCEGAVEEPAGCYKVEGEELMGRPDAVGVELVSGSETDRGGMESRTETVGAALVSRTETDCEELGSHGVIELVQPSGEADIDGGEPEGHSKVASEGLASQAGADGEELGSHDVIELVQPSGEADIDGGEPEGHSKVASEGLASQAGADGEELGSHDVIELVQPSGEADIDGGEPEGHSKVASEGLASQAGADGEELGSHDVIELVQPSGEADIDGGEPEGHSKVASEGLASQAGADGEELGSHDVIELVQPSGEADNGC
ncbi:hypothetical protein DPX39_110102900 [Trypanosoma brucei equiperdum]|uniref:Uncharacterized protein n=1 Tax=Trypanosoma brucei equiperdum TaxID=630700 RepID=A0A3L6KYC3_9TRYP|nr:hypothetical protein DPX39_110102900 [Trypanosoma brucei equiperdum]